MEKLLKNIYNDIFDTLYECKIKYCDVQYYNSYFLFEFDYDKICHFRLENNKNWLFGIWLTPDLKNKKVTIELFGEHEEYIDKFKPSRSIISFNKTLYLLENNSYGKIDLQILLFEFIGELNKIQRAPYLHQYLTYGIDAYNYESFIEYFINYFWEYKIKNPFNKWFTYDGLYNLSKYIFKPLILFIYPKLKIKIYNHKNEFYSPRCTLCIIYDNYPEDKWYDIYSNKLIQKISRINYLCVSHRENDNAKRGFYYPEQEN